MIKKSRLGLTLMGITFAATGILGATSLTKNNNQLEKVRGEAQVRSITRNHASLSDGTAKKRLYDATGTTEMFNVVALQLDREGGYTAVSCNAEQHDDDSGLFIGNSVDESTWHSVNSHIEFNHPTYEGITYSSTYGQAGDIKAYAFANLTKITIEIQAFNNERIYEQIGCLQPDADDDKNPVLSLLSSTNTTKTYGITINDPNGGYVQFYGIWDPNTNKGKAASLWINSITFEYTC